MGNLKKKRILAENVQLEENAFWQEMFYLKKCILAEKVQFEKKCVLATKICSFGRKHNFWQKPNKLRLVLNFFSGFSSLPLAPVCFEKCEQRR